MAKNKLVAPVVKWVGGKRQLIDEITPLLPKKIEFYCEPFLGGGAVLFSMQPPKAIVNDLNRDLMIVYEVIRDNVEELIESLKKHENTADYFYEIRDMLSNSATEFIKDLYSDYDVRIVKAKRIINANVSGRGAVEEVLIRNYGHER